MKKNISLLFLTIYCFCNSQTVNDVKLNVSQTTEYKNGIYKTYQSFKDQKPDIPIVNGEFEGDKLSQVYFLNSNQQKTALTKDELWEAGFKVFGVVVDGKPFARQDNGQRGNYFPLEKKDNTLRYSYIQKKSNFWWGFLGGALGGTLVSYFIQSSRKPTPICTCAPNLETKPYISLSELAIYGGLGALGGGLITSLLSPNKQKSMVLDPKTGVFNSEQASVVEDNKAIKTASGNSDAELLRELNGQNTGN